MAKYDVSFKVGESGSKEVIANLEKIQKLCDAITGKNRTLNVDIQADTSTLEGIADHVTEASTQIDGMKQKVMSLGDAFQSLGSLSLGAGNFLQQFASFFGSDVIGTATRTVTSYATILASNGLSQSISRYDIMTTFPKMMEMMGYDADNAAEAVNTLNEAVLGLPTSLSDIVEQAQTFTTLTGDLEKGVEYAIAANNAFLAGGADTSQVYYGTKQLQDLISSGELKTMEWQSLLKALGPSWREIGKEMGYAEDELIDFRSELVSGGIDGTEFLEAMVRAGTGTGKLAEMADLSKDKVSSALTNIQTAFASLGQSVIETLNDSFLEAEGVTLADKIKEIGSAVKTDLKPYVTSFVKENFPKIEAFIDKLEGYDWMGLIQKVAEGAGLMMQIYESLLTKLPTSVVSFGMIFAQPLGKLLSGLGSLFIGLGNFQGFKGISIGKVSGGLKDVGTLTEGLKSIGLKTLNTTGLIANIAILGLVIKEYAGIAEEIGQMKIGPNYSSNLKSVLKLSGSMGGLVTAVTAIMSTLQGFGLGGYVAVGELLTAGLVEIIALTGDVLQEYANAISTIGSLRINSTRLHRNLSIIAESMAEMQIIMGANGLLAIIGGIGELTAAGVISIDLAAIDRIIDTIAKISELGDIDVDWKKLRESINNIKTLLNTMVGDDNFWTAYTKADTTNSLSKASENIGKIFTTWNSIITSFKENRMTEDGGIEDTDAIVEQITKDAEAVQTVISALTDGVGPLSAYLDEAASGFMEGTVDNLASILSKWQSLKDTFAGNYKGDAELTADWKTPLDADETLADRIATECANIKDTIQALVDGIGPLKALFDKWSTGNMSESAGNLEEILATWQRIQNKLAEFEVIDITDKINTIMEQFNAVMDAIAGGDEYKSVDENGNTIYSPFAGLSNFIDKLGEDIIQGQNESILTKMSDAIGYIEDIIGSYSEMQTKVQALEIDPQVVTDVQTMFQNLYDMSNDLRSPDYTGTAGSIESWQLYLENVDDLVAKVIEISDELKDGGFTGLQTIRTFFESRLSEFQNSITTIDRDSLDEKINNIFFMFNQLKSLFNLVRNIEIDSVTEKLTTMQTMLDTQMLGLMKSLITIKAYMEQLGIGSEDGGIITLLNSLFTGLGGATSSEGFETFNAQLVLLSENLDNISLSIFELYDQLVEMQPVVEGYSTMMAESIVPNILTIYNNIMMLVEGIPMLSDAILLFRDSQMMFLIEDFQILIQLVQQLSQLLQIDLVTALGLVTQAMQQMQTATTNLTEAVINLTTAVNKLSQTLRKLQQELKKTQQQMQQCTQKARELAAAINAIPDHKTVTIDIVTNGSVPTFASTGGYIAGAGKVLYRSKGGFTPKGTDTVPAMLTPGEYVMSKKAVDTFGTGFFQRLNHLDIKGAMARVGTRVNRIVTNQYSVTNQTTHDNHATVNQYITTNNEQFSYRRARRFVEAL